MQNIPISEICSGISEAFLTMQDFNTGIVERKERGIRNEGKTYERKGYFYRETQNWRHL